MGNGGVQINLRLPAEVHEKLEAIAFLEGAGTIQKLLRQLIDDSVEHYLQLATVQQALATRAEHLGADRGKVRPLPKRSADASSA